jgi:hypothetical protein
MSSSDTSSLSSAPPTDDESISGVTYATNAKITNYFKEETPPPPKRAPSPPHEYVLADNPDIAVCVFRNLLVAVDWLATVLRVFIKL